MVSSIFTLPPKPEAPNHIQGHSLWGGSVWLKGALKVFLHLQSPSVESPPHKPARGSKNSKQGLKPPTGGFTFKLYIPRQFAQRRRLSLPTTSIIKAWGAPGSHGAQVSLPGSTTLAPAQGPRRIWTGKTE